MHVAMWLLPSCYVITDNCYVICICKYIQYIVNINTRVFSSDTIMVSQYCFN